MEMDVEVCFGRKLEEGTMGCGSSSAQRAKFRPQSRGRSRLMLRSP